MNRTTRLVLAASLTLMLTTPVLWAQGRGRQGQGGSRGGGNGYGAQRSSGAGQGYGRQGGYGSQGGYGYQGGRGSQGAGPRYGQMQNGFPQSRGQGAGRNVAELAPLSSAERQDLIHMREEEKLARDVYITLGERWNTPVFTNISRAESNHMRAIAGLIGRYGFPDPVEDNTVGVFQDPHFTELYESLVADGLKSIDDAYDVGRRIEELDIADLDEALERTQNESIRRVYQNLRRASENHLRAFTAGR